MKTRREFIRGVGARLTGGLLARGLPWVGVGALLWPRRVEAAITLNSQDPTGPGSDFIKEGTQNHTAGTVLTLFDQSSGDFVAFFATDTDAAGGTEVDVIATFQVTATIPNNADAGNRVVINDGVDRSAIAACIIQNSVRGIGLLSQGPPSDPASYPVFVPVDWRELDDNGNVNPPVTIRMRRTAAGDAEIVEVNGVAPNPRALLAASQCPAKTRNGPTVEFGARSPEAECTVEYHAFHSERVDEPVFPMTITPAHAVLVPHRIRGIALDGAFELDHASNGIDPVTEGVTLELSTPGGLFYPAGDVMPVGMRAIPNGWSITDAERAHRHRVLRDPADGAPDALPVRLPGRTRQPARGGLQPGPSRPGDRRRSGRRRHDPRPATGRLVLAVSRVRSRLLRLVLLSFGR